MNCALFGFALIKSVNIKDKMETLFLSGACLVDWVKNRVLEVEVAIVAYATRLEPRDTKTR
jgi:hypothetical protein